MKNHVHVNHILVGATSCRKGRLSIRQTIKRSYIIKGSHIIKGSQISEHPSCRKGRLSIRQTIKRSHIIKGYIIKGSPGTPPGPGREHGVLRHLLGRPVGTRSPPHTKGHVISRTPHRPTHALRSWYPPCRPAVHLQPPYPRHVDHLNKCKKC